MRSTSAYLSRIIISNLYVHIRYYCHCVAFDSLFLFSNFISNFAYLILFYYFIITIFLYAPFLILIYSLVFRNSVRDVDN